ncbi:MAG: diguanylate cyclase, partial [Pseudomonadota bacterium]
MLARLANAVIGGRYAEHPKRLWRRYVVGLCVIVGLLMTSHLASLQAAAVSEQDAAIINDSGRQRMLSQRILFFAEKLVADSAAAQNARMLADMRDAIDLFETTHIRLSSDPALSPAMRGLYFGVTGEGALDQMVRDFARDAWTVLARAERGDEATWAASETARERMVKAGPGPLLRKLNAVVMGYEAEAQANLSGIVLVNQLSMLMALVALTLGIFGIFMPAHYATLRANRRLRAQAQDLEKLRAAAQHEALHDALTGLPNRRHLEQEMTSRCAAAAASGRGVGVLHIDLDRFKQINDTLGHAAGDHVLRHVADTLRAAVGPSDFVGRVGGDEFVVLMDADAGEDTGEGEGSPLQSTADGIIEGLSKPVQFDGELCHFGASVGIDIGMACASGPEIDPARLLANADIALYSAKGSGRGRAEYFTEEL